MFWHFSCDASCMQAVSHAIGTFAPISASRPQALAVKPLSEPIPIQPLKADTATSSGLWEKSSFSFWDIIDAINPLQHIPIISTIYRKITGDEMGYAPRIAGDTLYSGIFGSLISGLVSAVANVFVDSTTGKDIGEHMMAAVTPPSSTHPSTPAQQRSQQAISHNTSPVTVAPSSASITPQHTVILPSIDPSRMQAGIDQYKWQAMAGDIKTHANHWV